MAQALSVLAAQVVLVDVQPDGSHVVRKSVASHNAILLMTTLAGWFGVTGKPGSVNHAWPAFPAGQHVYVSRTGMPEDRARVEIRIPDAIPNAARPALPDTFRRARPCVMGVDLLAYLGAPDAVFKARGVNQPPAAPRKMRIMLDAGTTVLPVKVVPKDGPCMALLPKDPTSRPVSPWPEIRVPKAEVPLEPTNADGLTWPLYVQAAGYSALLARLDKNAAVMVWDSWKDNESPSKYVQIMRDITELREGRAERKQAKERKAPRVPVSLAVSLKLLSKARGAV